MRFKAKHFFIHIELAKAPLSLFIALSAGVGFLLANPMPGLSILSLLAGVFLLAAGAASINNFQDGEFDKLFSRTRGRAIPSGTAQPRTALFQGVALILIGLLMLWFGAKRIEPILIGSVAVILYNLLYTPLKKRTQLAILPGAICGALPVFLGWSYAGGGENPFRLLITMVILGVWQVPHSWLVVARYPGDYQTSHSPPSLSRVLSPRRLLQVNLIWIGAYGCLTLLSIFSFQMAPVLAGVLIVNMVWLIGSFTRVLWRVTTAASLKRLSSRLEISLLVYFVAVGISLAA